MNALKLGSRLETILNDYRELQLATATDHLNLDEKQSDDKLVCACMWVYVYGSALFTFVCSWNVELVIL